MKGFRLSVVIVFAAIALSASCDDDGPDRTWLLALFQKDRGFHMGFTPFPSESGSYYAMDFIYDAIRDNADLIAHHFDNGIPWDESLSGDPYPSNIMFDWDFRKTHTPAGHKIYIAITPINSMRDGMAPAWNSTGDNQALGEPWATYAAAHDFDHADVKTAYLNYCRRVIGFFEPDYIAIGIEVNLLRHTRPAAWAPYLDLHQTVYTALKAENPGLPIMVSMTGIDLLDGYTGVNHADQISALADIIDYTDYFGISLHPHLSAIIPDLVIPDDMFTGIFTLSGKPACITETSFLAETLTLPDPPGYIANGTPEKQRNYTDLLLDATERYRLKFAVWFLVQDYDALWVQMGSPENILKAWRDTGIYDENGDPRPALEEWKRRLRQ